MNHESLVYYKTCNILLIFSGWGNALLNPSRICRLRLRQDNFVRIALNTSVVPCFMFLICILCHCAIANFYLYYRNLCWHVLLLSRIARPAAHSRACFSERACRGPRPASSGPQGTHWSSRRSRTRCAWTSTRMRMPSCTFLLRRSATKATGGCAPPRASYKWRRWCAPLAPIGARAW